MALKFLNKKGWHTGSLRNIENVWKAEQKHDAEQKKLEELRKQIHEERERSEFRQLQEAAGLVPRQERLDFLYESGLAVGKGSSEGFKVFQAQPSDAAPTSAVESSSTAAVPGALFEDKPHSANDAWRKLHSDPLLLIRRSEQEALARIKNNPIRMAMIQKSVESEKLKQEVKKDCKKKRNKHKQDQRKLKGKDISKSLSSFEDCDEYEGHRRRECSAEQRQRSHAEDKEDWRSEEKEGRRKIKMDNEKHDFDGHKRSEICKYSSKDGYRDKFANQSEQKGKRNNDTDLTKSNGKQLSNIVRGGKDETKHNLTEKQLHHIKSDHNLDTKSKEMHTHNQQQWTGYSHQRRIPKITEEERDARLREMQMNAELHEDQRRKRLKRVAEADALEAKQATYSKGKTFLDATQKSVYGMEAGRGTIEESVRRRSFYSQDHSAHESNAFRR